MIPKVQRTRLVLFADAAAGGIALLPGDGACSCSGEDLAVGRTLLLFAAANLAPIGAFSAVCFRVLVVILLQLLLLLIEFELL
jgi:hypothetical protein